MNISVKRTGGFAGVTEDLVTINTTHLDSAAAQQVEQMVQSIDFFNLPTAISGEIGADLFHYEITIIDGDRQYTVAFDDAGSPETAPLRQFVESLIQLR